MARLFLEFRDQQSGELRRVAVDQTNFVVGRQPGNNLAISDSRLSRQHARIDVFGSVFVLSDLGSSNGTTRNGQIVREPQPLENNDVVSFGGVEVSVVFEADEVRPRRTPAANVGHSATPASADDAPTSAIPTTVFFIAPVLALLLLVCGGGALYLTRETRPVASSTPSPYETTPDDAETDDIETERPTPSPSASVGSNSKQTSVDPPKSGGNETASRNTAVEAAAAGFLQSIAKNDPTAFLNQTQIEQVLPHINSLKSSAALAENMKAARASSSAFRELAAPRGLKPQFLAAAALARLGNTRGNPIDTARQMADVFSGLRVILDSNLADDNLLVVAAYEQGKDGRFKDLRNQLEALAKKNPSVGPREIRTIWFLRKQGKLTESEFDFALRFIAVGTIAQNPAEFGVKAEKFDF